MIVKNLFVNPYERCVVRRNEARSFCVACGARLPSERGYTLVEMLAVIAVLMVGLGIAIPHFASMNGQLASTEDARIFANKMSYYRAEAARLRQSVTVSFDQATSSDPASFSADFDGDGVVDETVVLSDNTQWAMYDYATTPGDIEFNGLGIARSLGSYGVEIQLQNNEVTTTVTVLGTGLIKFGENDYYYY